MIITRFILKNTKGTVHDNIRGLNFSGILRDSLLITGVKLQKSSHEETIDLGKDEEFEVRTIYCIDNKGKNNKSTQKRYSLNEGLRKFEELTGLRIISEKSKCITNHPERIKGKPLNNVFEIVAKVKIIDSEKFIESAQIGIGSRKSYGFGFIEIFKN